MFIMLRIFCLLLINAGFLGKLIPISIVYGVIDVSIYIFSFLIIYQQFLEKKIRKYYFCVFLSFICIAVYVSVRSIYSDAELGAVLTYTFVLFRFFFFTVIIIEITRIFQYGGYFKKILSDFNFYLFVQFVIVIIQQILPSIGILFIPISGEAQSSFRVLETGYSTGSFANSIELAFFALVLFVFNLRVNSIINVVMAFVSLLIIYFTGSKGALFLALVSFIYHQYVYGHLGKYKPLFFFLCFSILVSFITVNYNLLLEQISARVDNMYLSRLGIMFEVFPSWYSENWYNVVIGSLPDFKNISLIFSKLPTTLAIFEEENRGSVINDTYWFALIISYGLVIFLFVISMLLNGICIITNELYGLNRKYYQRLILLLILSIGLINQVLMVRTFYMPLFILIMLFSKSDYLNEK